jgi:hypothetical protein
MKKLLILGGNPETASVVIIAKKMGLITYVVDLVNNSPAKRVCDYSFTGNAADVKLLTKIILDNNIEGVLVGVADILVPAYEEVCRLFNFPCYANLSGIKVFASKDGFINACKRFGLLTIPNYTEYILLNKNIDSIEYPVMVKPVDSGGGVGMSIANDYFELIKSVNKAKLSSRVGRYICEKYMINGQDIQAYYTIVDGEIFLSSIVDRTTNKSQGNLSPVCIGALYNSKFINLYIETFNSKFIELIKYTRVENGVLSVQCFVDEGKIYPYDPGFRLQGEGQHLMLNAINGFDHREMLINFSLNNPMWKGNFAEINDLYLKNKSACSVWILLRSGLISNIEGIDYIKNMPNFMDIMIRFEVNDRVFESFIGTEKQVFARIYLAANNMSSLRESVKLIHSNLIVQDDEGLNMIVDYYQP